MKQTGLAKASVVFGLILAIGIMLAGFEPSSQTAVCTLMEYRIVQRDGQNIPVLVVRLENGTMMTILLHNGLENVPIKIDGVDLSSDGTGVESFVHNNRHTKFQTRIIRLASGVVVPAGNALELATRRLVYLASNPPGARITLGEEVLGQTPALIPVWGRGWNAILQRDGYLPTQVELDVQEASNSVTVGLRKRVNIRVTTEPAGVPLYLDGQLQGSAPLDIEYMGTNGQTLVITASLSGYIRQEQRFVIGGSNPTNIAFEMGEYDMRPRRCRVETWPTQGVEILINNVRVGMTPLDVTMLGRTNGSITLRRTAPDQTVYQTNIAFDAISETNIHIREMCDQEPRELTISNDPTREVDVHIAGRLAGRTPVTLTWYSATNCVVELSSRGVAETHRVTFSQPGTQTISGKIDVEPRKLCVYSIADNIVISVVNGKNEDTYSGHGLVYGPNHVFDVTLARNGYKTQRFQVPAGGPNTRIEKRIKLDIDWSKTHDEFNNLLEVYFGSKFSYVDEVTPLILFGVRIGMSLLDDSLGIYLGLMVGGNGAAADNTTEQFCRKIDVGLRYNVLHLGCLGMYLAGSVSYEYLFENININSNYIEGEWSGLGVSYGFGLRIAPFQQGFSINAEYLVNRVWYYQRHTPYLYHELRFGVAFSL